VTVASGGNEQLVASVDECTRDLVAATLEAHVAAVTDSFSYEKGDRGLARRHRSLEQIAALRRQLDDTSGPVVLSGSTPLIVEVIRDTTTQATHELDILVEGISATPSPLSDGAVAELRARARVVNACLEALVACEVGRGRV
jgi:hypothetical protein